jgi:tRNA A-37 threonylcarbamoyl transferase component Bud32
VDPRIGTELAGHRIEAVIGRGGASVVYLAEHVRLRRNVALKVLAPHLADDEDFRERFIRESRIAATLDHPNIVTVYDAGEDDDALYISMRYIEGSDLAKVLRAGGLGSSRAILILSQIAAALDVAHGRGLVHRDVKPGNVLLGTSNGGSESAYLTDFGISKRTTSGSGLTRTGRFVGTVDYVAPEQINNASVDGRTDVYSLGCVLYECLTGRSPFRGDTDVGTIYRHLNDPPPTYDELGGSNGMDEVLARALAKSKEDRFPTCVGLIDAARVALSDTQEAPTVAWPSVQTPASSGVEGRVLKRDRGPRRARSVWLVAVGVGIAVLISAAVLAWPRGDGTPEDDPGPRGTGAGTTTAAAPTSGEPQDLSWNIIKERTKPGDQSMDDVIATDEGLVAVGHVDDPGGEEDGAVWRSTNIDRWQPSGSSVLGGPGDQRLLTVAEFGDLLVAGGWEDDATGTHEGAVWVSRDGGRSWEEPSVMPGGVAEVRGLAVLGSTIVAVGDVGPEGFEDAAVWTSSNGIDWTKVGAPDLGPEGDQELWSVHAAGGMLIAVGSSEGEDGTFDAAVWTSTTGTEWHRVDPAMFEEPGNQLMKAVAGGVDELPFVIVGCEDEESICDSEGHDSDAAVWVSEDGEIWDEAPLEGSGLVGDGIQTMVDVVRDGDHFIAVGRVTANPGDLDGANWFSEDGSTWDLQLRPTSLVALIGGEGNQAIRALTPLRRPQETVRFVAVGITDGLAGQDAVVWGGS